jgi:transcriptional regulator of acetoin/glycerol metabolism
MTGIGQRRRRSDVRRPPDRPFATNDHPEESGRLSFGNRRWKDVEREYILYLLDAHRWNVTRAARAAVVNRSTFASRMRRLGIRKEN